MQALARIFLKVQPSDPNAPAGSICRNLDVSVLSDGLVVLGNLVSLGQVGIEVVFAGEDRGLADLAIQRHGCTNRVLDGLSIQNRKRSRQSQAHRADVRIRRRAKLRRASAKRLRDGEQLDVYFQADYGFVLRANVW